MQYSSCFYCSELRNYGEIWGEDILDTTWDILKNNVHAKHTRANSHAHTHPRKPLPVVTVIYTRSSRFRSVRHEVGSTKLLIVVDRQIESLDELNE